VLSELAPTNLTLENSLSLGARRLCDRMMTTTLSKLRRTFGRSQARGAVLVVGVGMAIRQALVKR